MDNHALSVLADADSWKWPVTQRPQKTGKQGGHYKVITSRLLYCLITESQWLGGTVLDQFWNQVRECHPKLKENVDHLSRNQLSVPLNQSSIVLFEGIDRNYVNLDPVFKMAAEYFTHLGIPFIDVIDMETEELLAVAEESGERNQAALKCLAFKRDGYSCVTAGVKFNNVPGGNDYDPILAHVIPSSIHSKLDTLKCIAVFAGEKATDLVIQNSNRIDNVVNLQTAAHSAYVDLKYGIEARNDSGTVEYIYRRVPFGPEIGPSSIRLRDGDQIMFGLGSGGLRLGGGPLPLLCNLHLAVARILKMSGAAEVIAQLMEDADDSDLLMFPPQ